VAAWPRLALSLQILFVKLCEYVEGEDWRGLGGAALKPANVFVIVNSSNARHSLLSKFAIKLAFINWYNYLGSHYKL